MEIGDEVGVWIESLGTWEPAEVYKLERQTVSVEYYMNGQQFEQTLSLQSPLLSFNRKGYTAGAHGSRGYGHQECSRERQIWLPEPSPEPPPEPSSETSRLSDSLEEHRYFCMPDIYQSKLVGVDYGKFSATVDGCGSVRIQVVAQAQPNFHKYCRGNISRPSAQQMDDVIRRYTESKGCLRDNLNLALGLDSAELAELGTYIKHFRYAITERGQRGWPNYLYLGMSNSDFTRLEIAKLKSFYIPSFVSASKLQSIAYRKEVCIQIDATQALALDVGRLTSDDQEEIILPCYSGFEVTKIDQASSPKQVSLKVLPYDGFKPLAGVAFGDITYRAQHLTCVLNATLRAEELLQSTFLADLESGTRLSLLDMGSNRIKVEVISGQHNGLVGWVTVTTRSGNVLVQKS